MVRSLSHARRFRPALQPIVLRLAARAAGGPDDPRDAARPTRAGHRDRRELPADTRGVKPAIRLRTVELGREFRRNAAVVENQAALEFHREHLTFWRVAETRQTGRLDGFTVDAVDGLEHGGDVIFPLTGDRRHGGSPCRAAGAHPAPAAPGAAGSRLGARAHGLRPR